MTFSNFNWRGTARSTEPLTAVATLTEEENSNSNYSNAELLKRKESLIDELNNSEEVFDKDNDNTVTIKFTDMKTGNALVIKKELEVDDEDTANNDVENDISSDVLDDLLPENTNEVKEPKVGVRTGFNMVRTITFTCPVCGKETVISSKEETVTNDRDVEVEGRLLDFCSGYAVQEGLCNAIPNRIGTPTLVCKECYDKFDSMFGSKLL